MEWQTTLFHAITGLIPIIKVPLKSMVKTLLKVMEIVGYVPQNENLNWNSLSLPGK